MLSQIYKDDIGNIHPHRELTVLVIDPDPVPREELKSMLGGLDMVKMTGVRNTHTHLIDTLSENNIDVIIFDENTGLENIYDAVREVRIHPNSEEIGFVLMVSQISDELIKKGAQLGLLGFLLKPFAWQDLVKAMSHSLGEVDTDTKVTLASMRDSLFFASFSDREMLRLLNMCRTYSFHPEASIFREGEPGETMFVVLSGQVSIRKKFGEQVKEVSVINPGETFGEMAILDNYPRSADAVAAWDTTVFEINHATLQQDDNILALKLSRQIAIMLAGKIRAFNYR